MHPCRHRPRPGRWKHLEEEAEQPEAVPPVCCLVRRLRRRFRLAHRRQYRRDHRHLIVLGQAAVHQRSPSVAIGEG